MTVADPIDAGTFAFERAQDNVEAGSSPTPTPNPCVNESPIPVVDANHNGIPDNETWTYTNCTRPGPDGTTHTLGGIVNVKDTSSGSTTAWTRTTTDYSTSVSGGTAPSYIDLLNGTSAHTISNSATQQTIVDSFTNQVSQNSGSVSGISRSVSKQTTVFTSTGATISPTKMPPSGTITVSGTREVMTEKNGSVTSDVTYTTTTPTALTYDATCKTPPRITAGVMTMASGNHTVTLTYNGCGHAPAVTKT